MTQPLQQGQKVRLKPREGTIVAVGHVRIKRHGKPPRYTYTEVPTYLVEFADGSRERLSAWELEASNES